MECIYGTALTQVITRVAIFQISQGQENKQTLSPAILQMTMTQFQYWALICCTLAIFKKIFKRKPRSVLIFNLSPGARLIKFKPVLTIFL